MARDKNRSSPVACGVSSSGDRHAAAARGVPIGLLNQYHAVMQRRAGLSAGGRQMNMLGASRFTALLAAVAISGMAGTFWWALETRSDMKAAVVNHGASRTQSP
jgi:hypothetical protein